MVLAARGRADTPRGVLIGGRAWERPWPLPGFWSWVVEGTWPPKGQLMATKRRRPCPKEAAELWKGEPLGGSELQTWGAEGGGSRG